jgi:hypothetical protein
VNSSPFFSLSKAAAVCIALGAASVANGTPTDALAAGKFMSFSHAADVLESQCQAELRSTKWASTFASWRSRNSAPLEVVQAYGRRVKWYPANSPDPSRWQAVQRQERAAVAAQLADVLAKEKAEQCKSFAEAYEKGEFDLKNFPEDLRAIEAYGR